MKKRAFKAALLFVEITAIAAAVFAAIAAYLYMRLQQGPVSLGAFKQSAAFAIERRLPQGYDAKIGGLELAQHNERFLVQVRALEIYDADGAPVAGADNVAFVFDASDILARRFGPQTIDAVGAEFRIVRNEEQDLKIPAARGRQGRPLFPSSDQLVDRRLLNSAFQRADMRDAKVTFFDVASGRAWVSENASLGLVRTNAGIEGALSGAIDLGEATASIDAAARYDEADGMIALDIAGESFPIGDLLTMFYGDAAAVVAAPVSGAASIELASNGDVRASAFNARIGEGLLTIAGADAPIRFVEWETGFDPEGNRFTIDRFAYDVAGNSGTATGTVALEFGDDIRDPQRVLFDINAKDLVVTLPGRLPAPLPVNAARADGDYDITTRTISLDALTMQLLDIVVEGAFSFMAPREDENGKTPSPGVVASLTVDGALDPPRLLRVWPLGVAMGARDWIEERLETATINNIEAAMDLKAGAVNEDGLVPDEAMIVTFDVAGAKAYYVEKMTPLTNASGSGVLRGNSFVLTADRAQVGDVAISKGEIEFPVFIPKWQPTFIRFTAAGRSEDILGVLDEEPLFLLSKTNLSPDQFRGEASTRVEIMRPNKRHVDPEEYEYRGEASFNGMTIDGFAGDVALTGSKGTVSLKPRSLTVKAEALLTDAPIDVVWKKNFFEQDGPSEISIAGVVDAGVGDAFGLSLRQYLRGPINVNARATGEIGQFDTLALTADFSTAAMSFDLLGWRKSAGSPVTGDLEIAFDGAATNVRRIDLRGDGVAINGVAGLENGVLEAVSFPVFQLAGAADVNIAGLRQESGELGLTVTGDYFNAGSAIMQFMEGGGDQADSEDSWGRGLSLTARLDELELRNGIRYRDTSLDFWRNDKALQVLEFSALSANGAPLKASLAQMGAEEGPDRRIIARSSDLGGFLNGLMGFSSLQGGEGSLALLFGGDDIDGMTGELEARGLHVVDAPLLARIFSAGSLDGLANLVQGEGIDLSYAYGEFDYRDAMLALRDFRATGPSVGMTAEGAVSFETGGEIALNGAVAPVYQLNSALGAAPIIGDILVGKEGEGLLALSYSVSGERAAPNVFVNPLSALTPGIFRQLFQPAGAPELAPASEPVPVEAIQSEE